MISSKTPNYILKVWKKQGEQNSLSFIKQGQNIDLLLTLMVKYNFNFKMTLR